MTGSTSNHALHRLAVKGWIWLVAASVLLPFANLRTTIPWITWLAAIPLLRFLRINRTAPAILAASVVVAGAIAWQMHGMIPAPALVFIPIVGFYALLFLVPFLVDLWLASKVPGPAALLVLPVTWTTCEYGTAMLTPYGSWGSFAYSQYADLALIQIVSITGIYGVTFLIALSASVANHVLEHAFAWKEIRAAVLAFVSLMVAVLIFGEARLRFFAPDAPTVRVASLTSLELELFPDSRVRSKLFHGIPLETIEIAEIRRRQAIVNEDLLTRAEREAVGGAKIVFWGETNSSVLKRDEATFLARISELTRRRRIYVLAALGTLRPGEAKPLENKVVLIGPDGRQLWQYRKARPVPGQETAITAVSDGQMKSTLTPFGRISSAICFDLDFPAAIRKAGVSHTDILLVPANDWRAIDPWHSEMATFRAIEGGFNLVRQTSNGLSLAVDFQGRQLASMDHFTTTDRVLVSNLPTHGVPTIYARAGDWFAWLCAAALLLFAGRSVSIGFESRRAMPRVREA